jgi:3-hydroxypropanoate dehydrogenase
MNQALDERARNILFREARSHSSWLKVPVSDELLRDLYDLMKWGPTSANSCPARIVFARTPEAKQRLVSVVSPLNVEKVRNAPVTAIIAWDVTFYDKLPKLFPNNPKMRDIFAGNTRFAETTAFRNSSLQGGYFILAARSLGLDCGPMSGFDNAKLDAEFFPGGQFKSNFLCNLGHGDPRDVYPRNARLDFGEACQLV